MPTVFDRWATEQPSAATKYADISIVRVVTEADNETRITDASRIKEMTVRFLWRQAPLKPSCFSISFTGDQDQAVEIPYDQGTDFVFRSAGGAPNLATSRYFTVFVNQVPTGEIAADAAGVVITNGRLGKNYQKSMRNIEPHYDFAAERIDGWTSDCENMINETTNPYLNQPTTHIFYDLYQREGMIQRIERARLYGFENNDFRVKEPQYFFTSFYDPRYRLAKWADAVMLWRTEPQDSNGIFIPTSTYYQDDHTTTGYTVLLYRQKMDVSYYGLRPNKNAVYVPADPSGNGLLAATTIGRRGDFWEL